MIRELVRRVFKRKDAYYCLGFVLFGLLLAYIALKLPEKLIFPVQIIGSLVAMAGAFMFSRVVQNESNIMDQERKGKRR